MKAVRLALLSLACLAPLAASAQWQWLDKSGRKVFSDQPPPPDIAPDRILRQGGARGAVLQPAAPVAATSPAAPAGVDPALKPSGKDKVLEEKRKQAEAAQAEKKKAEEAKIAAQRADNCGRARSAKTAFASGQRMALINDKGEREVVDDTRRAAEIKRLDEVIARDCVAGAQ